MHTSTHPFDADVARRLIDEVTQRHLTDGSLRIDAAVTRELVAEFGVWTVGWKRMHSSPAANAPQSVIVDGIHAALLAWHEQLGAAEYHGDHYFPLRIYNFAALGFGASGGDAWRTVRAHAFATFEASPDARTPVRYDGHRRWLALTPTLDSSKLRDAMQVALDACRASADAGETLTLEKLAAWRAIVTGDDAALAIDSPIDLRADASLPLAVQAARVYLDIHFFAPFKTHYGVAARLALDHTLTRASMALHAAEPVFALPLHPTPDGATYLARVLDAMTGSMTR